MLMLLLGMGFVVKQHFAVPCEISVCTPDMVEALSGHVWRFCQNATRVGRDIFFWKDPAQTLTVWGGLCLLLMEIISQVNSKQNTKKLNAKTPQNLEN